MLSVSHFFIKIKTMDTKKLSLGALAGGLTYFLSGWLLYGILFANMLGSVIPGMKAIERQSGPDMVAMLIGNLVAGFLLAYIFEKWAGIRTFMGGAIAGATIGFLVALGYDSVMHGTTTLMTWGGVVLDSIIYAVMSGLAGGVAGWVLGYKRA